MSKEVDYIYILHGFRIYRLSRGIKRPTVYATTEEEAMKRLEDAVLIYERTIGLMNGTFDNIINYRTFNFDKRAKKYEEEGSHYEEKKE